MNELLAVGPPSGGDAVDDAGIAEVVAVQGPRLRAFVRRQVADLDEVEDIVQEAFLELVSAHRLMEPIQHVAAWLLRVARNRIIDRFRRGSRWGSGMDASWQAAALANRTAPAADGPEAACARARFAQELSAALAELPAEQRDTFVAHELEGRSFRELAAAGGVSINTLLGRKHAAVRQLRRRLQALRSEFDDDFGGHFGGHFGGQFDGQFNDNTD
jgi:RNA polymerase sigma factor (sigma-70 family)